MSLLLLDSSDEFESGVQEEGDLKYEFQLYKVMGRTSLDLRGHDKSVELLNY